MVRRDATDASGSPEDEASAARCATPAGARPVPVSVGAPGSRPQAAGGDPHTQAGRQELVRQRKLRNGERARGPQHEVKPAASTEEQTGGRAAHVTAKATPADRDPKRAVGPGGVRGAARVQGGARNTRDPSAQPRSRQGDSYKPKAKSSAAQRESEGVVVPVMAAKNNAAYGKDPWGGRVGGAGKREGMAGETGPNDPGGRVPRDKVRELQRRLWAGAKRAPGRRFHALHDQICRDDVLWEAWERVRRNRGVAGVDSQSIRDVEQNGVQSFLE